MNLITLLFLFIPPVYGLPPADNLESVRSRFEKATVDRNTCAALIRELSADRPTPTHLAYLGALQAVWANHVFNPLEKLNTFNRGKRNLEQAVALSPENPEIRFLRLSVQIHSPAFLGYRQAIDADKLFVARHLPAIQSAVLRNMMNKLLKSTA